MRAIRLAAGLFAFSALPALAQEEGIASFDLTMHAASGAEAKGHSRIAFSRSAVRGETEMEGRGAGPNGSRPAEKTGPAMRMTMIQKLAEPDKLYLLDEQRKTYSVMDLAKLREQANTRSGETWSAKRSGSETIAGIPCEKALLTSSKGTEVDVCVATSLPITRAWWTAMNRGGRPGSGNWVRAMDEAGMRGFPIRMSLRSSGRTTMEMVLVRLEKKPLPASTFEIPAGYRLASGGDAMSPEQRKAIDDALAKMTPEQRKQYEEMMKKSQEQPPNR